MIKHIEICDRCKKEYFTFGGSDERQKEFIGTLNIWESKQGEPHYFMLCNSCEKELGNFIWFFNIND